jgi:hypothetical protein
VLLFSDIVTLKLFRENVTYEYKRGKYYMTEKEIVRLKVAERLTEGDMKEQLMMQQVIF